MGYCPYYLDFKLSQSSLEMMMVAGGVTLLRDRFEKTMVGIQKAAERGENSIG